MRIAGRYGTDPPRHPGGGSSYLVLRRTRADPLRSGETPRVVDRVVVLGWPDGPRSTTVSDVAAGQGRSTLSGPPSDAKPRLIVADRGGRRTGDHGRESRTRSSAEPYSIDDCQPGRTRTGDSVAARLGRALLDAIRRDVPAPTVHARNLFHLAAAMWDAWAAYDAGRATVPRRREAPARRRAARAIRDQLRRLPGAERRYRGRPGARRSRSRLDDGRLGYRPRLRRRPATRRPRSATASPRRSSLRAR